ncbi:MAG: PLP-dependent aminotransferase family protein [Motilibacteraceae bacterium]
MTSPVRPPRRPAPYDRVLGAATLARLLGGWEQAEGAAYATLAGRVSLLVLDGRLPLRTRLPSERELAAALGLSRTTVTAAYERLRVDGFLASRQGSGSWTRLPGDPAAGPREPGLQQAFGLPDAPHGAADDVGLAQVLDLVHAAPPAPSAVGAAMRAAVAELPRHLPGPGYAVDGLAVLRAAVAARHTARGLPTRPEQVHVTNGAQHALALVLRALGRPGDRVLVEDPTYPNALTAVRAAGLRPVPTPVGEDGWHLDQLEATLRRVRPALAYLVPDHHNPTGQVLDVEGRRRVLAAAAAAGTTVVVDETLAELALDPVPAPPLAALGPGVVTLGSTSKTFWGGVRIGWVRADEEVLRRVREVRTGLDLGSPVLEQLVAAQLLERTDEVLAERLPLLRAQRDALVAALAVLPWRVRVPPGGLSVWVDLGARRSSELAVAAPAHGLRLASGPRFGVDGGHEHRLRLPFTLPVQAYDVVARRLAGAWEQVAGREPRRPLPDPSPEGALL